MNKYYYYTIGKINILTINFTMLTNNCTIASILFEKSFSFNFFTS